MRTVSWKSFITLFFYKFKNLNRECHLEELWRTLGLKDTNNWNCWAYWVCRLISIREFFLSVFCLLVKVSDWRAKNYFVFCRYRRFFNFNVNSTENGNLRVTPCLTSTLFRYNRWKKTYLRQVIESSVKKSLQNL